MYKDSGSGGLYVCVFILKLRSISANSLLTFTVSIQQTHVPHLFMLFYLGQNVGGRQFIPLVFRSLLICLLSEI